MLQIHRNSSSVCQVFIVFLGMSSLTTKKGFFTSCYHTSRHIYITQTANCARGAKMFLSLWKWDVELSTVFYVFELK